jgi:alpha-L-arabinofuranosidase
MIALYAIRVKINVMSPRTQVPQVLGRIFPGISKFILAVSLAAPMASTAQTNMTLYADSLVNGWSDGSYGCTHIYNNTLPVHSGSDSISVTITNAYGGIGLSHSGLVSTGFVSVSFWLNGGTIGGQQLQMYGTLNFAAQGARYFLTEPLANTWQLYTVSLSALGVANTNNFTGFVIQDSANSKEPTFYLDDIQLNPLLPPPTVVHVSVNAGQPLRTADARWFGINGAIYDSYFDTPTTVSLLNQLGTRVIRLPGGSLSDEYHWVLDQSGTNTFQWATSIANFLHVITNASVNAQAIVTANYGTGTPQEAAAWVAYCNATTGSTVPLGVDAKGTNWQTAGYWASLRAAARLGIDDGKNFLRISRTAPIGLKDWEIGNECYGGWETDSNAVAHDPYTYALRATNYFALMKAVDPTIEIGVVSTPGEDSSANYTSHPAYNSREGVYHNGWTPVMLTTLTAAGVTPDFLVDHFYPQSGSDNDATLLQASANWASDAASLRQQITDYVGSNGINIILLATENNSDSGPEGKQSTSLVNGLYLADSLAQLTKTEFNSSVWWDLRNGQDTTGDFSASLYGWRTYGDLGIIGNLNTLYPTFYTFKLMQDFVQAGDTVLTATSDYSLLSTYAVRRRDGSLTVLAINKDPSNTFTGQVAMASFTPAANGTVFSYGMPQDNAAKTNGPVSLQDVATTALSGAGTNFNYVFAPYSATVLSLAPAPATLLAIPTAPAANQFVFQLQGQAGVPYVLQSSPDLLTWTPVSTNTLVGSTLNVTNLISPGSPQEFWRAVWLP